MILLTKALNAWETPAFEEVLKREIEELDGNALPLQQGLSQGSYTDGNAFSDCRLQLRRRPDPRRRIGRILRSAI